MVFGARTPIAMIVLFGIITTILFEFFTKIDAFRLVVTMIQVLKAIIALKYWSCSSPLQYFLKNDDGDDAVGSSVDVAISLGCSCSVIQSWGSIQISSDVAVWHWPAVRP